MISLKKSHKFETIEKSADGNIRVIATAEVVDADNEIIKASGYDIPYLMKSERVVNLEHIPYFKCGEIVKAEFVEDSRADYVVNEIKLDKTKKAEAVRSFLDSNEIGSVSIEAFAKSSDVTNVGNRRVINKCYPSGIAFCKKGSNPESVILSKSDSDPIEQLIYLKSIMPKALFDEVFPMSREILYLKERIIELSERLELFGIDTGGESIDTNDLSTKLANEIKNNLKG